MKFFLLAIAILCNYCLLAQDSSRIFLAAGSRTSDIPLSKVYRFNPFKPGVVLFYDGQSINSNLNYNFLNGEMEFIAPNGDTLAIAKEQMLNIKRVTIDTISFIYNKGYLEIIKEHQGGTLAKKQQYFIVAQSKMGAYNQENATSSIDSYTSFMDRQNNQHNLSVRENITMDKRSVFYVGDSYRTFLIINKRNLDKIFFKKRVALDGYLKEHNIDFNSEKDLTALFVFLSDTPSN